MTSNPGYDFGGQVAFVTGASSGTGLATARAFAEQGAAVALADLNEDMLREASGGLEAAGHRVLAVVCDVSDEAQVGAAVERTVATFSRLDIAFNNAGIMIPPSDAADEPADNFDRVNAINLRGVWACMKHSRSTDARCRGPRVRSRSRHSRRAVPTTQRCPPGDGLITLRSRWPEQRRTSVASLCRTSSNACSWPGFPSRESARVTASPSFMADSDRAFAEAASAVVTQCLR
jgi:hypothetical protein